MNRKQKLFHTVSGFLIGNIILVSIISGVYYANNQQVSKNAIFYNEALERVKSSKIKAVNIKELKEADADSLGADNPEYLTTITEELRNDLIEKNTSSSLFDKLFQVLFILFIISPPIIVVLLLVIISKMNRKNSLE